MVNPFIASFALVLVASRLTAGVTNPGFRAALTDKGLNYCGLINLAGFRFLYF